MGVIKFKFKDTVKNKCEEDDVCMFNFPTAWSSSALLIKLRTRKICRESRQKKNCCTKEWQLCFVAPYYPAIRNLGIYRDPILFYGSSVCPQPHSPYVHLPWDCKVHTRYLPIRATPHCGTAYLPSWDSIPLRVQGVQSECEGTYMWNNEQEPARYIVQLSYKVEVGWCSARASPGTCHSHTYTRCPGNMANSSFSSI